MPDTTRFPLASLLEDSQQGTSPIVSSPPFPLEARTPEPLRRMAQMLRGDPGTKYMDIIPQAQDQSTGQWRWAMPNMARGLLQGFVDLAAGPYTGQMTPEALGSLMSLPAGGAAMAPRGAVSAMGSRGRLPSADPAKEMGFVEKTYYHGTDQDISRFDKDKVNARFPHSFGFHLTDQPWEANMYARNGIDPKMPLSEQLREGGNVMPVRARYKNPLVIETKHTTASMEADINRASILKQLEESNAAGRPYDAVVIKRNFGDPEWDHENVIVFDPSQIRSVFAKFDKSKGRSGNVLSGSAGVGKYGLGGGPLLLGEKES